MTEVSQVVNEHLVAENARLREELAQARKVIDILQRAGDRVYAIENIQSDLQSDLRQLTQTIQLFMAKSSGGRLPEPEWQDITRPF